MHLDSGSTVVARSSIWTNSQHLSEVIASLDIGNKNRKQFYSEIKIENYMNRK